MKTRFSAGKRVLSRIIVLTMAFSMAITASAAGPTTTVGDGTSPGNKFVTVSSKNQAVSSFTLSTNSGTDTVTGLVVTGTNTANVAANGVSIWRDNGSTPNEWDATDALMGSGSFSGTTATFTGLTITETTTAAQYIITYDLKANPTYGSTLTGRISGVSVSGTVINNDDVDATLTVDTYPPGINFSSPSSSVTKSGPVTYTVSYTGSPSSGELTISNITLNKTGTADGTVALTGNRDIGYKVTISGIVGDGKLGITVAGGIVSDAAGNSAAGGTSSTFTVDNTAPTVTINQAATQADPASTAPINFTVVFSEPVINFTVADVTIGGTAVGTTAIVTGSGATYNVAMSGMTSGGTVIASIAAGVASDAAGNLNTASTSTDNTVTLTGYSVTYNPGTQGTFSAQVTSNLLYGATTPAAPVAIGNLGYTFAGWSPAISLTVTADATYTAQWTANEYTITFNSDGGSAVDSITASYGSVIEPPTAPTKDGYTFKTWSPAVPATMPAGGATLTAQWTADNYTITFNSNGGSDVTPITAAYGSVVTAPQPPTKAGYNFAGWDIQVPTTMPLGGAVLTAQWTAIGTDTIIFNSDGGTFVAPITAASGSLVAAPENPTKTGYTFNGWSPAMPATMPVGGATLTAQWTVKAYIITFNSDGGTPVAPITAAYGSAVTAPANPTKAGYTFTGWDSMVPATMPLGGAALTATWTINQYTITFNSNGGSAAASITADYGTAVTPPAVPTRAGYTFGGWKPAVPTTMPVDGATLTAQWIANEYTITFNSAGGSSVASITAAYGLIVTAPTPPSRTGYTFTGWDSAVPTTMPIDGATLTAIWTINQYTLNFNSAGGSAVDSITGDYNSAVTAPADPTRAGYTFGGWDPGVPATMPASGASLTAQWTANTYTMTFNSNGGSSVASITAAYGSEVTAPANPTKSGYSFTGWSPAVPATMPLDGAVLTAQWTVIGSSTITFNSDGGSPVASITAENGSAVTAPAAPTKAGYTFNGWNPALPATMPAGGAVLTAQWTAVGGGGGGLGGGGGGGAPSGGGGGGSFGGGGGGGVLGANSKVYNDVQQGDWYYEAVQYVVNAGLFSGTSDTTFEPNTIMTRGMIVTVLYSLEGKPAISAANPFKDVKSGMWYANAVVWAAHNGIVGGYTSTTFGPNDKLTREQLAVILYNYAAYKHYDMTLGNNVNLQSYTDVSKITSYANNAVKWAYGAGIMLGKTSTTLAPKDNASRAEVAKVFMMLMTTVVN